MKNSWENYGDVNPIEHGGMFVKKDTYGERNFYVIQLTPMDGSDKEEWLIQDGYIDLDDSWIEWGSVQSTMDTPKDADDEYLATDVMHYYGGHTGAEEFVLDDREEVVNFLQNRGIEVE